MAQTKKKTKNCIVNVFKCVQIYLVHRFKKTLHSHKTEYFTSALSQGLVRGECWVSCFTRVVVI